MDENMIKINGTLMEMSSNEAGDLVGKFLVCPLDEGNDNKVGLRRDDLSESELLGLKNKALVTKVITNKDGELDFSGHNRKIKTVVDSNGNVSKEIDFDTSGVGFHSNVYIEDITFPNGLTKECIIAEAIVWSRYEKVCSVIERLGTSLKTSWEIAYGEHYFEDGIKWLKNITWLGNCLLGSNVRPAYKDAGMLEVAEEDDLSLEVAFSEDIINIKNEYENGGTGMDNKIEIAQLSMSDLESRIRRAIYGTEGDGRWYYGILIYPLDNVAYAKLEKCGDSKIEDYTKFTYTVNSDDTVSIIGQEDVQMVFISKETQETELAEKDAVIAEKEAIISQKDTEISESAGKVIKLGETIAEKDTIIAEKDVVIAELKPFKTQVEEINRVKEEAELAEKKETLKAIAKASFTDEEIEVSEELKSAIDSLDEVKVKTMVADKVFEIACSKTNKDEKKVEISEEKEVKINTETSNHSYEGGKNAIYAFINKNKNRK